jgi:hypothetical protein
MGDPIPFHNTPDMQAACEKLVAMANRRGGHDNITVIAAECGTLNRIPGLGIRTGTVSIKRRRRNRLFIALLCITAMVLIFYILVIYRT